MGLLIGMFIGETLRINPVIEEGAGKLTSMAKNPAEKFDEEIRRCVDGV